MMDYNRPYSRIAINKAFVKRKCEMHKEAIVRGVNFDGIKLALYEDVYTGIQYRGGDSYEYEHLRSSHSVFEKFKHLHTDEEIAKIVNIPENVGITSFEINRHKDKYQMETRILEYPEKIINFMIDINLTKANLKKADKAMMKVSKEILIKN